MKRFDGGLREKVTPRILAMAAGAVGVFGLLYALFKGKDDGTEDEETIIDAEFEDLPPTE